MSSYQPIVNIRGEKVALGPASRDQLPAYARWFSDFETTRTQGPEPAPRTIEERSAWLERETSGATDRAFFSVYDSATWQHIGFVVLREIDHHHGTATMSMMVGETSLRGRGFGTEMTKLTLDYGFTELGLRTIMLVCFEYNLAGHRAYEKAGFREIGRWRQARKMGGRHWDIIFMECLASEFVHAASPTPPDSRRLGSSE